MEHFIQDEEENIKNQRLTLLATLSYNDSVAVYYAIDQNTGKKLTVKFVQKNKYPNFPQFLNGLEILRRMNHKDILRVYDAIHLSENVFLVKLENYQFNDLRSYLHEDREPLLEAAATYIMYQISCAVSHLHRAGIVHNNLRTSNVLIKNLMTDENYQMKVCLTGFSLSHYENEDFVSQEDPYIAPEIVKSQRGTLQSDIFSLGILFYEIITGTTPADYMEYNKINDPFEGEIWGLRVLFRNLIKKMLEVDPARRPTAEQILNDEVFNFIRDGRQKTETELDTAGALDECFIDMALNDALPYIEDEDKF